MSKAWVFAVTAIGMSGLLSLQAFDDNDVALSWLGKAHTAKCNATYQLEEVTSDPTGKGLASKEFQKINSDGTVWYRRETLIAPKVPYIKIQNDAGSFEILGDLVTQDNSPNRVVKAVRAIKSPSRRVQRLDADTFLLDGRVRISRTEQPEKFALIEETLRRSEAEKNAEPPFPKVTYLDRPCYEVKYVDKTSKKLRHAIIDIESGIVLYERNFDRNGKFVGETKVTLFKLNPQLSDSLFSLPKNTPVQVTESNAEQGKLLAGQVIKMQGKGQQPPPGFFTNTFSYVERQSVKLMDYTLKHGGGIFGSIAGIILALLLIAKLKKRSC